MLTMLHRLLIGVLFAVCSNASAGVTLWLSDASPHGGHGGRHSHGGPVEVRRGIYYKNLWLRLGVTPQDDGFVTMGSHFSPLVLLDAKGQASEQEIGRDKAHGLLKLSFPMPDEGFYNAYVSHQWVNNGQRRFQIAKAEVLKHSCREGHDHVREKMPAKYNSEIPLEIVRERLPKENFHTLIGYGDTVTFTVLRNGKPLSGAEVSLATAQGWSKRAVSDGDGRVSYTMIRDYYPAWYRFDKRHAQPYLVAAEYTLPESGELDGVRYESTAYIASFSGNYYPSARDYESYAYGLLIGIFALVFSGLAIYLYRRRRNRPYREVRFDE